MVPFGYRVDSPKREKSRQSVETVTSWYK